MSSLRSSRDSSWLPSAILIVVGVAAVTCLAFALAAWAIGRAQTREFQRQGQARLELVSAFARACRQYCADYLRPALEQEQTNFIIEGMSSTYMTERILRYLSRDFPGLIYRQASPNPLNPDHRPTAFEQRLLDRFRDNRKLDKLEGIVRTARGEVYYVARPIVAEKRCLKCHGDPQNAPYAIRERYGTESGFGWKPGEVVGLLMVSVPVADILASQARVRSVLHTTAIGISLLLSVALGLMLLLLMRWNWKLRHATQRAEAASAAKSAFLATMSHEIRTPLTAILGYADELALLERDGLLPSQAREPLDAIRTSGRHLLSLINDILDLARVEAGRLMRHITDVRLPELLHDVCSIMRVRAAEKGLKLSVRTRGKVPAVVRADPAQLRQILVNLVGNAVKFTEEGEVSIELAAEPKSPSRTVLKIAVRDTGIGIAPDKLDQLFEPFVQVADSAVTRAQGTGLGLAVTKRLVELAGGWIAVESELGVGTTFHVTLPVHHSTDVEWLDEAAFARASSVSDQPANTDVRLDGCHVLLCEDNPMNARLVRRILERVGVRCEHVTNGQEAVEYFRTRPKHEWPDVVLMDLQMPVMDGMTAVKHLRAMGVSVPILALSANVMKDDRDRCLKIGFNDYLCKPINRARLLERIRNFARRSCRDGAVSGSVR